MVHVFYYENQMEQSSQKKKCFLKDYFGRLSVSNQARF